MARGGARPRSQIGRHHAEWLSLVQTAGPFLTVPVLERVLPDGLEAVNAIGDLRVANAEWQQDPGLQRRWIRWVLDEVLELGDAVSEASDADPSHLVAEQGITLRPDYVVRDHTQEGDPAVLLVARHEAGVELDRPMRGEAWAASPVDRAAELARGTGVPLVLVTDGQRWTLVWAREGESTGTCTWRAELWLEEPLTLRAFVTLLGARRFFTLPVEEGLAALLQESAGRQQEVADQLGAQVRRAVELLIATLDHKDRDRHGGLLQHLEAAEVYRGAVAVMMRLVFLFVGEERRLLPIDDPRYAETLAASTLRAQLQERADRYGEDPLERSTAAWHRVLALFRAVHGGVEHDALRLPAYGGGLFDPDRYPFLEGRREGGAGSWRKQAADPLPVDDRTMLHLLDALQTLEQGGARVLLSYEALDVEQIGHVYEGLLDHTAVRLTDAALALSGKHEPELALGEIERWAAAGEQTLRERLAKATGRSASAIGKGLAAELPDERQARLRAACGSDDRLLDRVTPYHALLRDDLRGDPLVLLPGSLFVTQALDRRSSGTYYTPRELAEEVVRHALDPIAYEPGPAQERDPTRWKLKSSEQLLELKVADIAMGSGAFLVASCRYLAARLLEAWAIETAAGGTAPVSAAGEQVPADPLEREALAHRLVAERCLYGVDKNPMAVEMAKLSLWLITLARQRPFSFVDHALRTGDSLLGVTDLRQLRVAHLDPTRPRQSRLDLGFHEIETAVDRALALRRQLEGFVVRDVADADRKTALLDEAEAALADARLLGDLVVGAALAEIDDADPLIATEVSGWLRTMLDHEAPELDRMTARTQLRRLADGWLVERRAAVGEVEAVEWSDRHPFHWALEFPEVWERGGFDGIVGNPPFQGGSKISGTLGAGYRSFVVRWLAAAVPGNADLVAYFFLRASSLLRQDGSFGLIATNSVAQRDTRQVGLDQLVSNGIRLYRAIAGRPWPGGASLEMASIWARRGRWIGVSTLDNSEVSGITTSLTVTSRIGGKAERLHANRNRSFNGSKVEGQGFVLSPEDASELIAADPRNADVVRRYLIGQDLNQRQDGSPSRWVIDFGNWPEEKAREYPLPFERVERLVRPERARNKRDARRKHWWQFGERSSSLYRAIAELDRCVAITITSRTVQPMFVPATYVFGHKVVVFAYDDDAHFGLLSSTWHREWAILRGSKLRVDPNYIPTECFETFPQPGAVHALAAIGARLAIHRSRVMRERCEGLTSIYGRMHDPGEQADDIVELREIHVELDNAVGEAYGWTDFELGHGFHKTALGTQFTFAPAPRQEVLDWLLELNHERYAEEVRQGLHGKSKGKGKRKTTTAGVMTLGFDDV